MISANSTSNCDSEVDKEDSDFSDVLSTGNDFSSSNKFEGSLMLMLATSDYIWPSERSVSICLIRLSVLLAEYRLFSSVRKAG